MDFTIDDEVATQQLPRVVIDSIKYIKTLPDGKLITSAHLAAAINISRIHLKTFTGYPQFTAHKVHAVHNGSRQNLYGNERTIDEYRQRFDNA